MGVGKELKRRAPGVAAVPGVFPLYTRTKMMIDRHSFRFIDGCICRKPGDRVPADTPLGGVIGFTGSRGAAPRAEATIGLRGAVMRPGLTDARVPLFGVATEKLQIPLDPRPVEPLDVMGSQSSAMPRTLI